MRYHYYIYTNGLEYIKVMFQDIIGLPNVTYIGDPLEYYHFSRFYKKIHNLYHNEYLHLPFKSIWNTRYCRDNPNEEKCYIFFMDWLSHDNESLFKRIKANKNNKIVVYFEDIVASRRDRVAIELIPKYVDLAITFDMEDAKNYNLAYYPTFMSIVKRDALTELKATDVCFFGASKKRFNEIVKVYDYLTGQNLICDFAISRLNSGEYPSPGIRKIEYMLPYSEYIQHVYNSNCLVEIIQDNSSGYTLRTWEAILYNKKLLTNNKSILDAPFFNPEQFIYYENIDDINVDSLKIPNVDDKNSSYKKELSPVEFINFIERTLV